MDNFRMIVFMDKDFIFGTIRSFILDYLRKDKKLKEGYKVLLDIKVSFERIKDMGLGHVGMRRVKFIAGNGWTERGTELASWLIEMGHSSKEIGTKDRENSWATYKTIKGE